MEGPSADLLKADEVFETYLVKRYDSQITSRNSFI
jgi:hypothetical protein